MNRSAELKRGLILGLVTLVVLMMVPFMVADEYLLTVLNMIGIYVILASSLNLIVGYTGQLSFAHIAFFGIGAYTSGLLGTKLGISFWLGLPAAGAVAAIVGFVVGLIALRFGSHIFVLVTLSLGEIIRLVFYNWVELTGGPDGLFGISRPENISLLGITWDFSTPAGIYRLIMIFAVISVIIIWLIVRSSVGRALIAIRENETFAEFCGINVWFYKNLSFTIGALFAGIAGSVYAHFFGYIAPSSFNTMEAIYLVLMPFFGGIGTIAGPIIGTFLLISLPEFLRVLADYRMTIMGLLLVLIILIMPQGIVGAIQSLYIRLKAGRSSRAEISAGSIRVNRGG